MAEFPFITEFERGHFWRRALALLIDAVVATVILQLIAFILFPVTGGRVQFISGLAYDCERLDALPEGLQLPADFTIRSITDCRHGLFDLTSARIVTVLKVPQFGEAAFQGRIFHQLDAEGRLFKAPTLENLILPFLLALRFWLDRGRGTPGRRICRLRLVRAYEPHSPLSSGVSARRYAAQGLPLAPLIVWSILQRAVTSEQLAAAASSSGFLKVPAACLLIAGPIAVYAIIRRKDAWYDRWAMTSVLRLDENRAPIPVCARRLPVRAEGGLTQLPELPTSRAGNYFARHWRGELSLPVSYWANGVALSLVTGMASGALAIAIILYSEQWPIPWLIAAAVSALVISLFAVWQQVGIWRAATRYKRSGRSFWGGAAKAAVALAGLQFAYNWVFVTGPQIAGFYEIVTGDATVGPHEFSVLADGEMLDFSGGITFGVATEFERLLDTTRSVTTVRLNSIGGRVREAQKMSDIVKARGLATYVVEDCLSACTIVFLGGKQRFLLEGGILGFHQPSFRGMTAADRKQMIAEEETRLRGFGLSRSFAERANAATPDGMWYPEPDELVRERVVTWIVPQPSDQTTSSASVEDTVPAAPRPPSVFPAPDSAMGISQAGRAVLPADLLRQLATPPPMPAPEVKAATTSTDEAE